MARNNGRSNSWWLTIGGWTCLAGATALSTLQGSDAGPLASAWVLFVTGVASMLAGGLADGQRRRAGQ